MEKYVQRVVKHNSFDDRATFVPAGHIGLFLESKLKADADKDAERKAAGARKSRAGERKIDPGKLPATAIVEIAPLSPTGPNPKRPQQIPPDAVQMPGGGYAQPGKMLVGEVTAPGEERKLSVEGGDEAAMTKALAKQGVTGSTQNDDDALVEGTVAEIVATLGEKTDDELEALRAAEVDREKPRKGVTDAIKTEQAKRASA